MKKLIIAVLLLASMLNAAVRASSVATFNASSVTITWPTGTVAGDLVMIWVWQGCGATVPTDWNSVIFFSGGTFYGITATKIMSSTDISNGSVAVTTGCGFNGVAAALSFIGAPGFREYWWYTGVDGTPKNITTTSSALVGDTVVSFSGCRSGGTAPTLDRGTLQHSAADSSAANGSLYVEVLSGAGAVNENFSYNSTINCTAQLFIFAPTGGGASQHAVGSSQ